ncbi:MAG: response regulator [Bacteroidetes bacterium]|nr:response regulator [Bacteroidota bacterium]
MKNSDVEILLIEDNHADAELTIRALNKKNLTNQIVRLENGAEALDYLFGEGSYHGKSNALPKIILLDLNMPKVGGLEVLKRIKSEEKTKKIPVVILTSSKEDPDIATCYALGANSFIVKPVEFDKFVKSVEDIGFYWLLLNEPPH